jgi:hypothetical protein
MANPTAEQLYETAKSGIRKLTATERRRVLIYLDEIGEKGLSNYDLARIFQVTEAIIRADKKRLLNHYVMALTPEAAMSLVARHFKDLDNLIVLARRGLDENDRGSTNERFYVETLAKLYKDRFAAWQEIGVVRKELGHMNVTEEKWVATVDPVTGDCGVHKDDSDNK